MAVLCHLTSYLVITSLGDASVAPLNELKMQMELYGGTSEVIFEAGNGGYLPFYA
jgi:hypothetical protein